MQQDCINVYYRAATYSVNTQMGFPVIHLVSEILRNEHYIVSEPEGTVYYNLRQRKEASRNI